MKENREEEILIKDPGNINLDKGSSLCHNAIGFNVFWLVYLLESYLIF